MSLGAFVGSGCATLGTPGKSTVTVFLVPSLILLSHVVIVIIVN